MIVRRPSILAALAVAIVWFCQFLTVHYNYGGNRTGLFWIALKRRRTAATAAFYALAFIVLFLGNPDVWQDTCNFGHVLSPLLLLTFIEQFGHSPLSMVDSRIPLNLASELEGVVRGLLK